MSKKRVLVIDDSAFNRRAITEMLEKSPQIEVIGTASDGEEGLKRAFTLKPDVITLDLEMPVMDGFTFLRILMAQMPMPVIVVSARDEDVNVFKALEFGAVDFLSKPTAKISKDLLNIEKDIIAKVQMVSELRMDNLQKRVGQSAVEPSRLTRVPEKSEKRPLPLPQEKEEAYREEAYKIVAIGASTGGPPALQSIITSLPKDFSQAVVISQHMPPGFTNAFAERLNRLSDFEVKEAKEGDVVEGGRILIAPGGYHMTFRETGSKILAKIEERSASDMYAPSVDVMFKSVAEFYEGTAIGVVLTGMGSDGKKGVVELKDSRAFIIAESEETSIVYGMPKEAVKTGKVDKILPLGRIPAELVKCCSGEADGLG